jgi:stage II sporulation protein D
MKLKPHLILIAGSIFAAAAAQAAPLPLPKPRELLIPSRIRVRLAEAIPKVEVRGYDLKIYEKAHRSLASAPDRLSQWELRCQDGRIRAIPLSGGGKTLELQEPVSVQSPSGFVRFHDRPYREELEIHSVGSFCEVVNHVDLEKYLDGLVNSEFNSKWSEEAIGAQVVAARTYAVYQITLARGDTDRHYDVDATVRDQVYDGSTKEDFRASRTVEKTRGWVLTTGASSRPAPLKAFYHSTCGGMTELPEHVWGNAFAGFRHAVRCPYCGNSPALNWQLDLPASEIVNAFQKVLVSSEDPRPSFTHPWPRGWKQAVMQKHLVDLRAGRWDAEGRVSEVITTWAYTAPETGRPATMEIRVGGARFREWVGAARFRSASFQVIARGNSWRFVGRGNGHGVGMCQWGAKTMGERGFKTAAILHYYYPDAILRKLW